jgi:acyl-coenzyme A synthetase/AMP-(fatty) acid ligase
VQDLLKSQSAEPEEQAEQYPPLSSSWQPETLATVYTSGSTGEMTACPKTEEQIIGEAKTLVEAFFPHDVGRVAATVPPGHIYGLLYSVLVPLLGEGSFLRETPLLPEAVAAAVESYSVPTLVTVPAHLRTLVTADRSKFASLERVFSSTAPLTESTVEAFHQHAGVGVTEIIGSSETGGIAYRERPGEEAFHPLPGVVVSSDDDGRLLVDSAFIDPNVPRPYVSADIVTMNDDGSFNHRGRTDGIIKVGGRRVSLPAMQQWLLSLDGVEDAALTAVKVNNGRGQTILAAVVSDGSWEADTLQSAMAERFERACLPRKFAFVDRLPREDNGKLQRERLLRLFNLTASGEPIAWELEWSEPSRGRDDDSETFESVIHVPKSYGWFEGHFPGYPVMAAAVQLREVVSPALRQARGEELEITRISRMKFTGRIGPDDEITVSLRWKPDSTTTRFSILKDGQSCSSGIVESKLPA